MGVGSFSYLLPAVGYLRGRVLAYTATTALFVETRELVLLASLVPSGGQPAPPLPLFSSQCRRHISCCWACDSPAVPFPGLDSRPCLSQGSRLSTVPFPGLSTVPFPGLHVQSLRLHFFPLCLLDFVNAFCSSRCAVACVASALVLRAFAVPVSVALAHRCCLNVQVARPRSAFSLCLRVCFYRHCSHRACVFFGVIVLGVSMCTHILIVVVLPCDEHPVHRTSECVFPNTSNLQNDCRCKSPLYAASDNVVACK